MEYINIDIGRVTVTLREEFKNRFLDLFGDLVKLDEVYGGWINSNNPSPSRIGFAAVFEEASEVYANFHDLPFYYQNNWEVYHHRIVSHVSKNPLFEGWRGHAHRFSKEKLPLLVKLLNQIAAEEEEDSEKTSQQEANLNPDWINTRELAPPHTISTRINEGEEYEDYIFRAISDVPDGENEFGIGGRNFLASWQIEKRKRENFEGLPNAAAMELKFNNKESSIVTHILDGKLTVSEISLGSGRELEDGIIEDNSDIQRRDK